MRLSVKGYLALLVGIFVAGLLVVGLVSRGAARSVDHALDVVSDRHLPEVRAALELEVANKEQQNALARLLLDQGADDVPAFNRSTADFQR